MYKGKINMIPNTIRRVPNDSFKRWLGRGLTSMTAMLAFGWFCAQLPADGSKVTASQEHAGEQMIVTGRLVGPDNKPVAGGHVAVVVHQYSPSQKPSGAVVEFSPMAYKSKLLATARTDQAGRFRLSGTPYSPALPYLGSPGAILFATAPGYGFTAQVVDHARLRQEVTVKMEPERVVRGRLIDLQGQPAVGVAVRYVGVSPQQWYVREEKCVPFWPKAVTTDDKGRFLFRGLGLSKVTLEARHPRFAPQRLVADAGTLENGNETTLSLAGARNLRGRVTYTDTGKPAASVRVVAVAFEEFALNGNVEGRTDEQGRFSLNTFAGSYQLLTVHPPEGSPYRTLRQKVPGAQAARQEVDLALPRGAMVRGVVREHSSGKPIAGARVQFRPRHNNNPFYQEGFQFGWDEENLETVISGPDGRFQFGVLPGPGHLFVLGPTLDYLPIETSWGELEFGRPGGMRYYPDGLVALETKPGTVVHEVTVELRRGVTLQGRVVGPDGKPVDRFLLLCRHYRPTGFSWWQRHNLLEGRDGRFGLPGCDPEKPFITWLLDPDHELGATVQLSAKEAAGQPPTVRLEPCGSAVVQFANQEGKPLVKYYPFFSIVITPGASMVGTIFTGHDDNKELEGDWVNVPFWFSSPVWRQKMSIADQVTDPQGRITFRTLIPGATYRIMLANVLPKGGQDEVAMKGWPIRDFTVKPGEKLILSEVLVDRQVSEK
jgi:protocatechuate 3,4-dioxygenase beta subunit